MTSDFLGKNSPPANDRVLVQSSWREGLQKYLEAPLPQQESRTIANCYTTAGKAGMMT